MPRFFVEAVLSPETDRTEIVGPDARHIKDVLRLRPGSELTVCDGARSDLLCTIESIQGDRVTLTIIKRSPNDTEPAFFATLYQGLPKGDKFDLIIQKSVELGAGRIVPMICERSIAKVSASDTARKIQRWNRIAQEAAKQCGRGLVPTVTEPVSFAQAVADVAGQTTSNDTAFIPYEGERAMSLRQFLETAVPIPEKRSPRDIPESRSRDEVYGVEQRPSISFLIGPEGGFSPAEMSLAESNRIQTVSLGRRILRTETASLAVLAMLGYHFDEF